jgi:hypothetical protein
MTVLGQVGRFRTQARQSCLEEEREQNETDARWAQQWNRDRKAKRLAAAQESSPQDPAQKDVKQSLWRKIWQRLLSKEGNA